MKVQVFILMSVIVLSLLGLFFFTGGSGAQSVLLLDADVLAANPDDYRGRELRVRGFVKPGSIIRYGEKADFIIENEGAEFSVHYDGRTQLPDTFGDGAPVRADGQVTDGRLLSTRVEAKCASKYEADHEERLEHPSQLGDTRPGPEDSY